VWQASITIARDDADYPAYIVLDSRTLNYPIIILYTEGRVLAATHTARFVSAHEVVTLRPPIDYRWSDAVLRRFYHPRVAAVINLPD